MVRRGVELPGVQAVARLDRRTARLAGRLNAGDIAVIDHVDLDRVTAEALVAAKPAAVINAQPSISGRFPNLGPEVIVAHGIPLLDAVGPEIFGLVKEGTKVRLDGDTLYIGEQPILQGVLQDPATIAALMSAANVGLATQLEAFAVNTAEFMGRERDLLLDGVGIPTTRTDMKGRHALVVVRGYDVESDLKALKHYVREYKPILIGVEGGADALLEAGHRPHVLVGEMDAVSDGALTCGAEVIVHATQDGRAPGLLRVQDLGVDAATFPTLVTAEDAALLIADANGAETIVTVGTHATLQEFLDRGRGGMASSFLTRLKVGSKLVDAKGAATIYRNRISAWALVALVLAAAVAVAAAALVSDSSNHYLGNLHTWWNDAVDWVQGRFS
jgi:uncharacterized membrane-anchored protein